MSNALQDLSKLAASIGPAWRVRLRTGATLLVLALIVLVAVRVGISQVAEPFPESVDPPVCTTTDLQAGDTVKIGQVTVSVINAGGANGLAGRTLSDLIDRGFGKGELSDAPKGTPRVLNAQIWTTDGPTAAVKLVRSHLKGKVKIVDRDGPQVGINVVVGENFSDVKGGKKQFRVRGAETTCVPTAPSQTPEVVAEG